MKKPAIRRGFGEADFPEPGFPAVGHEAKGREGLAFGDFRNVTTELLIRVARAAAGAFGFGDGQDVGGMVVQAIIGDAVPLVGIVAVHRNLEADPERSSNGQPAATS